MGCKSSYSTKKVPIENNIFSLLQTNQTNACIGLIEEKRFDLTTRINQIGDTLLHYACKKNNTKLVGYILAMKP